MGKRSAEKSGPISSQQKRAKRFQQVRERFKNPQNSFDISPGMKGFFVSCTRGREQKSASETIDLLEQYATQLYPGIEEDIENENEGEPGDEPAPTGGDIEDEIAREIASMKSKSRPKLFRYYFTTIECVVFIKCHRKIDPEKLAHFIFEDLVKTKQRKTRYTSRLIPAKVTTASKLDAIVKGATEVAHELLADDAEPTTFAVAINIRYCDDIKRDDVIPAVAAPLDVKHKVDLKNAKYTLVIEVFKSVCTIGLVENYNALRRFNLMTLFDEPEAKASKPTPALKAEDVSDEAQADGETA
ncbi:hypothetical protein IW146_002876 [Coemansia sp. RSA 922]|nr:hypothetical protein GGI14_001471 [Coemansia sp. S680]KAJ2039918.1 hypothetical protein H4S03_001372 [Coemansia sp. S3946]KAJ2049154.1 hypothetical protein H4S04_003399 [Coemansia sp. S16]KAJ2067663.1 hypothetical protein GGI08_001264 [Coemansia sp. S2]KAJ2068750.1 hypothetical protein GGH13_004787 [Coemansia sp. S155-1]KAJ2114704.1 hypothetical protein IW146_002876 [Coemansia sp. RSA 922]